MSDPETLRSMLGAIDGPKCVRPPTERDAPPVMVLESHVVSRTEECMRLADALHRASRAMVRETREEPTTARCFVELTMAARAAGWFYEARRHGTGEVVYFRERARSCSDAGARRWRRLDLGHGAG